MAMATKPRLVAESCVSMLVAEAARSACEMRGEDRDPAEAIGCRLGARLAARVACGRAYSNDALDVVKVLCKEVWPVAFGKPVDNLKTNHRGVFVLHDSKLRWLVRASAREHDPTVQRELASIAAVACGLIRGALESMGVPCTVQSDVSQTPACASVRREKGAKRGAGRRSTDREERARAPLHVLPRSNRQARSRCDRCAARNSTSWLEPHVSRGCMMHVHHVQVR